MKITLYGLELSQKYFSRLAHGKKLTLQEMEYYLGKKKRDEYAIVLAHNPVFFPVYAAWGADLVCSGHLHGGMVRIPGIGGIISPQMCFFPKYEMCIRDRQNAFINSFPDLSSLTTIKQSLDVYKRQLLYCGN